MCSLTSFAPPPPPLAGSPNPPFLFYRECRFRRDALNHSAIPPHIHAMRKALSAKRFFFNAFHSIQIRSQNLWDHHASISLLVVLQNSHQCSSDSQAGAIHGMDILGLRFSRNAISNLRPPGLKILKVATGRDLFEGVLTRKPDLNIISFRS